MLIILTVDFINWYIEHYNAVLLHHNVKMDKCKKTSLAFRKAGGL